MLAREIHRLTPAGLAAPVSAQELEPRALLNTPIGTNFVIVAGGYLYGNVLLDPAIPIEDLTADLWTVAGVYARSISVFGLSGKIGGAVPYATGTWNGRLSGIDSSVSRTGFGDPVLKLSVNFIGSPALPLSGFRTYRQSTVAGFSLAVTAPLGQYITGKLINLGSNRWSFAPRLGASKVLGSWYAEAYLGATFFTTNTDFFGGHRLTQEPLFDTQAHLIRLPPRPGDVGRRVNRIRVGRSEFSGWSSQDIARKRSRLAHPASSSGAATRPQDRLHQWDQCPARRGFRYRPAGLAVRVRREEVTRRRIAGVREVGPASSSNRIVALHRLELLEGSRAEVLFVDDAGVAHDEGLDSSDAIVSRRSDQRESAEHRSTHQEVQLAQRAAGA